ncbi:MAG TPA: hypothetical protein VG499_01660 [Actinomycetota bacterium]|nr:hypothetical protein [Actinomycetota bacterium]
MVAAATLAAPVDRLEERLAALHRAVPMTGARLRRETWHPGRPPEVLIVDGDPLATPDLVARFDLGTQPPLRVVAGSGGTRLAVACHHAAFDGLSLVALLAALVRPQDHPNDPGQFEAPQPGTGVVDNQEHPTGPSATLPLRGPEPRGPGLERGNAWWAPRRAPELRGLVGRVVRPADRVAASLARPVREALAVAEVDLAGPGVTARLASAAVAAAGAHNARLGRPWRRVGINVGLAGGTQGGTPGNYSRYRRVDLRAGEAMGVALDAALARNREPLDQVWSPRFGWVLEPVVGRFSDSLLVSNLGRREVPGATRLEFFPVARGRSAVAVGAAGLAGGSATVSVRARDLSSEDAGALLADLVARLEAGP